MSDFQVNAEKILVSSSEMATETLGSLSCHTMVSEYCSDLKRGLFTIVVVGEFNRGKSSFVNALLGQNLLPVGPTPTTNTLTVLRWAARGQVFIHKADGQIETLDAAKISLESFTADSGFDPSLCTYVEIGVPSEFLRQDVFIVDTPGVHDLNQQRSEIAAKYIPRADVVIFVLDGTAALKKSEQTFLEDSVLRVGLDRIIFVLNHMDRVITPDARERVIEGTRRRLLPIFGDRARLFPLSAKMALTGKLSQNRELLAASGITEIEAEVNSLLESGSAAALREETFRRRGVEILDRMISEAEIARQASVRNAEDLTEQSRKLSASIESREIKARKIAEYVLAREGEFILMARKSLKALKDGIQTTALEEIQSYSGTQFKGFIESRLPSLLRKGVRQWIETRAESLDLMLTKLAQVLASGLQQEFEETIRVSSTDGTTLGQAGLEADLRLPLSFEQNSQLKAGLLASGGIVLAGLLGAGIVAPIIGMVGFPQIREMFQKKELEEAKSRLIPALEMALEDSFGKIEDEVVHYIKGRTNGIRERAEHEFFARLAVAKEAIEREIAARSGSAANELKKDHDFAALRDRLVAAKGAMAALGKKA